MSYYKNRDLLNEPLSVTDKDFDRILDLANKDEDSKGNKYDFKYKFDVNGYNENDITLGIEGDEVVVKVSGWEGAQRFLI